jgi:hypothetical protein
MGFAGLEIDDAQAGMTHASAALRVQPESIAIRSPVAHRLRPGQN